MIADEMRQESSRVLPKAVTPENVPAADRGKRFHRFFRTFEIASVKKGGVVTEVRQYIFGKTLRTAVANSAGACYCIRQNLKRKDHAGRTV